MKTIKTLLLTSAFAIASFTASAQTESYDFADLASPERGTPTLAIGSFLTITALKAGDPTAFAYLDAGRGGLGVCGDISTNSDGIADQCTNPSDDNVTVGETLRLFFTREVTIYSLVFNNNHDGDQSLLGDTINIGGAGYLFTNGSTGVGSFTTGNFKIAANSYFDLAYGNESFYLEKITFTVPETSSLFLLVFGLVGLVALRKRSA